MVKFIADIGSNHNQNLDRCLELIDRAIEIGCWGVKFQLFRASSLHAQAQAEVKKQELPRGYIQHLSEYCSRSNINFGVTPFDIKSAEFLEGKVGFVKVSSFDILRLDLIETVAKLGVPVIISTGMATRGEVDDAERAVFKAGNQDLTFLHCVSRYPAHPEDCDLGQITFLSLSHPLCGVGWSDHTVHPAVIYRAEFNGAEVIEFHLDLDGKGAEYQHRHCWLPQQMAPVISGVRTARRANLPNDTHPITEEERLQRADPSDGLRPMQEARVQTIVDRRKA